MDYGPRERRGRSRLVRCFWILLAVFLVYIIGIFARWQAGAVVVVHNRSGALLHNVTVKVEYNGRRYPLGDLASGRTSRKFVDPVGESHVVVEFVDAQNHLHTAMVIGYIEQGEPYCGRGVAVVRPSGKVETDDQTSLGPCWRSWLDFVL